MIVAHQKYRVVFPQYSLIRERHRVSWCIKRPFGWRELVRMVRDYFHKVQREGNRRLAASTREATGCCRASVLTDGMDSPACSRDSGTLVFMGVGIRSSKRKGSDMNATTVAVDLAKCVFQLAVAHEHWRVAETQRLSRTQFGR